MRMIRIRVVIDITIDRIRGVVVRVVTLAADGPVAAIGRGIRIVEVVLVTAGIGPGIRMVEVDLVMAVVVPVTAVVGGLVILVAVMAERVPEVPV